MVKIDSYKAKDGTTKYSTKLKYLGADQSIEFECAMDFVYSKDVAFKGKTFKSYGIAGVIDDKEVWIGLNSTAPKLMDDLGVEKGRKFKITATGDKYKPYKVELADGEENSPSEELVNLETVPLGTKNDTEDEFMRKFKATMKANNKTKADIKMEVFVANATKFGLTRSRGEELWLKL